MSNIDWLCDETTGDLILDDKGDFQWTSTIQEKVSQELEVRLKTWQGQWDFNTKFGTPYTQEIMYNGNRDLSEINAVFLRVINESKLITSVSDIQSEFNPYTRTYSITNLQVYVDDTLINLPQVNPNLRANTYPTPLSWDYFAGCTLNGATIEDTNKLYKFMNYDLARSGDSTWWNLWVE